MGNLFFPKWQNFATFPCRGNSKILASPNGFKDARFGQDVIAMVKHGFNVGLALSMSNLIALDCDVDETKGYNGIETLKQLETKLGKLPRTLTQKTPRGGRHFIFSSTGITSPIGKIGKDIDVKYNGYTMIAPSSINGKPYEIIAGIDESGNFVIADLPQTWLNYLNKDTQSASKQAQKATFTPQKHKIYRNIDVEKMFNRCAYLQYCKDNADCLTEPEWYSMITVLAQIEDSDVLIHKLSEPYPKYSYAETQKKIENARKFGHSQSCDYLSANYPAICKNCHSSVSDRKVTYDR